MPIHCLLKSSLLGDSAMIKVPRWGAGCQLQCCRFAALTLNSPDEKSASVMRPFPKLP